MPFKKKLVIVSSSIEEAITKVITNNKEALKRDITVVLLSDLLFELEVLDELSDVTKSINWYKNGTKLISNSTHPIINRVNYIPKELFYNFKVEDRDYAQREFEAYIGFSFNCFLGVSHNFANGLCENAMSLPYQWKTIMKACKIPVPLFYWGPEALNTLKDQPSIIFSSIYNFTNWSLSSPPLKREHIFCFERPKGKPVFVLRIGKEMLVTSDITIPETFQISLKKLVNLIHKHIKHFISETLFFYDGSKLTFGCVSSTILRSHKNELINEFIVKYFLCEFDRCAN